MPVTVPLVGRWTDRRAVTVRQLVTADGAPTSLAECQPGEIALLFGERTPRSRRLSAAPLPADVHDRTEHALGTSAGLVERGVAEPQLRLV